MPEITKLLTDYSFILRCALASVNITRVLIKCKLFVCASVREDNPRASTSGLSPVQTRTPDNNLFIAQAFQLT